MLGFKLKSSKVKKISAVLVFAAAFFAGGAVFANVAGRYAIVSKDSPEFSGSAQVANAQDIYTGNPIVEIVKRSSPAVVNIDTERIITRSYGFPFELDPFFEEFFGQMMPRGTQRIPQRAKGSGFIVSDEGYILTNNHVIDEADNIKVTLMDGRSFDARKVGQDPTFDLAVIKIKADDLPVLELGDSDRLEVGEWVVAIGNPLGFENSVTAGVVSAKNRTLQAADINFQGFLQTDAAINPGNSGGPLIDLNGKAVGINTAIVPYAQGIGFAVPINMAKQVMDDLIKHGEVRRGWLGVVVQQLTPSLVEAYKIPVKEGAIIADVQVDSPAEKAGLERGDVIIAIDGQKVKGTQDVILFIRNKMEGDKVEVEVYRKGSKKKLDVVLGELTEGQLSGMGKRSRSQSGQTKSSTKFGITVSEIDEALKEKYELKDDKGLVITAITPGTEGHSLGLKPGDVILEINRVEMKSIADWNKVMNEKRKAIALLVKRDDQTLFISTNL